LTTFYTNDKIEYRKSRLFGDDVNRNKKNYVIGSIIYGLIVTLVTVVSIFILTAVLGISYADLANSVY